MPSVLGGCVTSSSGGGGSRHFSFHPLLRCRATSPAMQLVVLVVSILNVTVLLVTTFSCILVTISSLTEETGSVKMRGYYNTASGDVFEVFLARATLILFVSMLLAVLLVFRFQRFIRRVTNVHLDSLFA